VDVTASITSGKLHGLAEVRDTDLPDFLSRLDRLAAALVGAVNAQHSTGYSLDGTTNHLFFTPRQASGQALAANTGGGTLQQVTVFDTTQLTLDDYQITFTANGPPPTFDVLNTTTGETVASGQTYTAGSTTRFAGLAVVLNDSGTPPQAGDVFTISTTQGAARDIEVAAEILLNANAIAAGQTTDQGDNANALAIADLREAQLLDGATLGSFYTSLVSTIGIESQKQSTLAEHQGLLLSEVENHRESLAGVSLEEEQVDLIRFQQAFEAAATLVRIASELADEVINLVQ
jgi:flagellar hook-associated protein 1 FlgK